MHKRIDFSNLGGFPLEQDTLDFLQSSYDAAFSAVAALCGNKVIISGVEVIGSNVTSGWIAYNGELVPFVGGPVGASVVISTTSTDATFEDNSMHPAYFTKVATCGVGGAFPFADLQPLLSLQNIWRPGDIKERYCDAAYINNNFDVNGFGLNTEKGWRILSKAYPDTAGKVMVNIDFNDTAFNVVGKNGGEKSHRLTEAEMPSIRVSTKINNRGWPTKSGDRAQNGGHLVSDPINPGDTYKTVVSDQIGGGMVHNNLQPYFVILKLIKL